MSASPLALLVSVLMLGLNGAASAQEPLADLYTADSPDAFAMGTRNTQDDAFKFCKGKAIKKSTGGYTVQKKTPYDWCAVTDHAVMMGLLPMTLDKSSPLYSRMEGRIGALYIEQPVDDEDRTFSFALDEVNGVGAGIHDTRGNGHSYDLNLSVFDTGDAPVDTGAASALSPRGRVAGKNDDPYALILEFTYYWN